MDEDTDGDAFREKMMQLLSEGLAEGHIMDACIITQTRDGLQSMGIMDEPDEEIPSRALRLVSHWMYHTFSGAPMHRTVKVVRVERKGRKKGMN